MSSMWRVAHRHRGNRHSNCGAGEYGRQTQIWKNYCRDFAQCCSEAWLIRLTAITTPQTRFGAVAWETCMAGCRRRVLATQAAGGGPVLAAGRQPDQGILYDIECRSSSGFDHQDGTSGRSGVSVRYRRKYQHHCGSAARVMRVLSR